LTFEVVWVEDVVVWIALFVMMETPYVQEDNGAFRNEAALDPFV